MRKEPILLRIRRARSAEVKKGKNPDALYVGPGVITDIAMVLGEYVAPTHVMGLQIIQGRFIARDQFTVYQREFE